jgi:hypothetical protein
VWHQPAPAGGGAPPAPPAAAAAAKSLALAAQAALGGAYRFEDPSILLQALTHVSVLGQASYQRLEFLGDGGWARRGSARGSGSWAVAARGCGCAAGVPLTASAGLRGRRDRQAHSARPFPRLPVRAQPCLTCWWVCSGSPGHGHLGHQQGGPACAPAPAPPASSPAPTARLPPPQVSAHLLMRPGVARLPPSVLTKARSVGVRNSRLAAAAAAHGLHLLVRLRGQRLRELVRGYADAVLGAAAGGGGGGDDKGRGERGAAAAEGGGPAGRKHGAEAPVGEDAAGAAAPPAKRAVAWAPLGLGLLRAGAAGAAAAAAAPAPAPQWGAESEAIWAAVWRARRSKGCTEAADPGDAAAGGAAAADPAEAEGGALQAQLLKPPKVGAPAAAAEHASRVPQAAWSPAPRAHRRPSTFGSALLLTPPLPLPPAPRCLPTSSRASCRRFSSTPAATSVRPGPRCAGWWTWACCSATPKAWRRPPSCAARGWTRWRRSS